MIARQRNEWRVERHYLADPDANERVKRALSRLLSGQKDAPQGGNPGGQRDEEEGSRDAATAPSC